MRPQTTGFGLQSPYSGLIPPIDTALPLRYHSSMPRWAYVATNTGRTLSSDTFLETVEATLVKRVRPLPIGRKKGLRKHPSGDKPP